MLIVAFLLYFFLLYVTFLMYTVQEHGMAGNEHSGKHWDMKAIRYWTYRVYGRVSQEEPWVLGTKALRGLYIPCFRENDYITKPFRDSCRSC